MIIAVLNVTLPLWLVVVQWVLLFALAVLIIAMYRQLAVFLQLKDAGTERDGLPIGTKAPLFEYFPLTGSIEVPMLFHSAQQWSLLVFVDPGCVSCQNTVLALEKLFPSLEPEVQILMLTSAEPALVAAVPIFERVSHHLFRVEKGVREDLYQTHSTPFAYVIDPQGVIQAKGVAAADAAIRKLLRVINAETIGKISLIS